MECIYSSLLEWTVGIINNCIIFEIVSALIIQNRDNPTHLAAFLKFQYIKKFWLFWRQAKRSHNSKTRVAMPTKIRFNAFHVNLYLHEFFEPILFFDPQGAIILKQERPHLPKLVCMYLHQGCCNDSCNGN